MKRRGHKSRRSRRGTRNKTRHSRRRTIKQRGGAAPNTAVIVEFRKTDALPFVVRNALDNLNATEWDILIFHGKQNGDWLKAIIDKDFAADKTRIQLQQLDHDNMTQPQYSDMLMTKEFYEKIPTETFLIFQTDSLICAPHKDLIKNYMEYDYVGAPWKNQIVGNGGFSLRKKSPIIKMIETCPKIPGEDAYFASGCPQFSLKKPDFEKAKEFSIETVYNPKSFGIHKPWLYIPDKMDAIEAQCPGVKQMMELYKKS